MKASMLFKSGRSGRRAVERALVCVEVSWHGIENLLTVTSSRASKFDTVLVEVRFYAPRTQIASIMSKIPDEQLEIGQPDDYGTVTLSPMTVHLMIFARNSHTSWNHGTDHTESKSR